MIEFCTDARFLTTIDFGQYFIHDNKTLKNAQSTESIQWLVVKTLFKEMKNYLTERSDSRKHQHWARIGSLTISYVQSKNGMVIRIEFVNKDHSHS